MGRVLINHGNGWVELSTVISLLLFNVADSGESLLQAFAIQVNSHVLI
jgi:hypothetical protein